MVSSPRLVRIWLTAVLVMVVVMTAVGGTTRLTGSGLSMVEWRPLMGALPPLSGAAWQAVFEQYQQSPQYQQVNHWMTLADFQRIFFWEYLHRVFGRLIGVVVVVPWLWMLARGRMSRPLAWRTLGLFCLGGMQGLMGWFMVMSGLVDVPAVSHFRLAAHLLLAFIIAQAVLWVRLSLEAPAPTARPLRPAARRGLWGFAGLILVQVAYGAFMAGTHAGWLSSTFPDVNGHWLPTDFVGDEGLLVGLLTGPLAIHTMHRLLAWATLISAGLVAWLLVRDGAPQVRGLAGAIAGVTLSQVVLGAAVVVLHMPIALAVGHQLLALVLLSVVVAAIQRGRAAPALVAGRAGQPKR